MFDTESLLEAAICVVQHVCLDEAKGRHGSLQNGSGHLSCSLQQFIAVDNLADQTCAMRLCGVDPSARETEVAGQSFTDNPAKRG